jgi:hypothetical protein
MKLGKLNAAIDAAPQVKGGSKFGPLVLQKGPLKEALKAHFTGGRSQETYLALDENGVFINDERYGE